ncbi:hypothetical protein PRUPE_6G006100 [Prunus persica]|uniref:Uncharacterized protein n=1 Tax=Prunus persica TaxID=3760 RepID=A0A251NIC8_PRUPE|nr:hypothetical protein PRUPE_6G006100 [Prunus persica]
MNFQAFFVSNYRINFKAFRACFLFWGWRKMKIAGGREKKIIGRGWVLWVWVRGGWGFGLWVRVVGGGGSWFSLQA